MSISENEANKRTTKNIDDECSQRKRGAREGLANMSNEVSKDGTNTTTKGNVKHRSKFH
jgi:hypothetical protein